MSLAANRLGDLEELQVEAAERRAAIAGNEPAGVQPGAAVARLLRQQQARDRLRAVEQHARLIEVEAIGERRPASGSAAARALSSMAGLPIRFERDGA